MSNRRFRSDYDQSHQNHTMGRRYRGKFGQNFSVRTKWDRKPNSEDFSDSVNDRNSRQIRFNTNKINDNDNNNNDSNNRFEGTSRRDNGRNDRSFTNWASKSSRSQRGRQYSQSNRYQRRNINSYNDVTNERKRDDIDSQWFKISIPHGHRMEKNVVLQLIHDATQLTFTPYNYNKESGGIVFFVLGGDTADALRAISRKITAPTGHKMIVMVNRSAIPPTPINDDLTNTIKIVMSTRFDVNTNIMDLSKFREDLHLSQLGLYVPLSRPNMLNTVIKIIVENTPQIIALNFKDNKIQSLEPLVQLAHECQQLKAIDLSQNQIRNASELDYLKSLDLLELALEGNPLCETFEDQASYISCIRSRFPKLAKLDGEELPASIGFDIQEVSNLPQTQPSYLPTAIQSFIHGFFESYYNIYDSDDRQGLILAYHDQALFSFSISRQDKGSFMFSERLLLDSRNLLKVKDYNQRNKLIKNGKVQIVSALCDMPRTRHEPQSFHIDVPFTTNTFVVVVVNGVFREIYKKQEPLRAFCRTFFIVPQAPGFVIVNDILLLTNATVKQIQTYGQNESKANQSAAERQMSDVMDSAYESIKSRLGPPVRGPATQLSANEEAINKFMAATQMNRSFSQQCLEENGYNFDAAYNVFQTLNSQNLIPNEAFLI